MAVTSLESSSPASFNKSFVEVASSSPPMFSPSSDRRYWSTLRSRVDTLLENRKPLDSSSQTNGEARDGSKGLKEDTVLLLRGFDSMAQSLSQLSKILKTAVEGAEDLSRSPTLSEIVRTDLEKDNTPEDKIDEQAQDEFSPEEEGNDKKGKKRKLDTEESSADDEDEHNIQNERAKKNTNEAEKMKKAKNLAISMANKAITMARELKSIRSDLSFMQERCIFLEEENKTLRDNDGIAKGIKPEEDDLVRLQLEALLAEKSRLANENANLKRENQCLHQLVEYHQLTSQDLSASYENLIRGMCLDLEFSTPPPQEAAAVDDKCQLSRFDDDVRGFSKSLDECFDEEE